jgi:leucyl/phenylalanyl-tRNA---protein transferase
MDEHASIPLTPELLISAYAGGIFPMDVDGEICWFSPDPRTIIPLDKFHASRRLLRTCRSGPFEVLIDTAFEAVMRGCAAREEGTWISEEIVEAYVRLHELGLAHSVETWRSGELAGGLYGISLGGAFFGESMFSRHRDASKVALVALVQHMRDRGFTLFDVQFTTPHLARFGAREIPRDEYLARLEAALQVDTRFGG